MVTQICFSMYIVGDWVTCKLSYDVTWSVMISLVNEVDWTNGETSEIPEEVNEEAVRWYGGGTMIAKWSWQVCRKEMEWNEFDDHNRNSNLTRKTCMLNVYLSKFLVKNLQVQKRPKACKKNQRALCSSLIMHHVCLWIDYYYILVLIRYCG